MLKTIRNAFLFMFGPLGVIDTIIDAAIGTAFTHIANPVRVRATRILEVTDATDRSEGRGQCSPDLLLRLEDGRNFNADSTMTSRYTPVVGDYVVTQEDGYVYLNPKDVFERKYSPIEGVLNDVRIVPTAGSTPTPNVAESLDVLSAAVADKPIAALADPDRWKPTIGRIVTVKGYIANGTDEHPGMITRVFGAGEGALVNVTAFPDLQSPKILSSIPVYTSRTAARDAVVGPSRANGFAFFPDRG